ncbi:MAG TPA: OsmC family protein [Bdellovibrionales bacterium]|nr:OsmC family protein [Bdellovibrionales bacterium]
MVKMSVVYQGQKHCELTHEPSQSKIETDAPRDNQGKGERFSPTDLVGAALASCILTTMAIVGDRDGLKLEGARAEVEKVMADSPRRIDSLIVRVTLPAALTSDQRRKMEATAKACPVHRSLHPEVKIPMTFNYI